MPCPKCCFQHNWHSRAINKLLKNFSWKWKKIWASIHENCIRIYYTTYDVIIHICSVRLLFQACVYYKLTLIIVKFLTVTHREILSEELNRWILCRYFLWISKWYTCYCLRRWQFFRIQFWFRWCEYFRPTKRKL